MVEDKSKEKEVNKKIQKMISDTEVTPDEVIQYVKDECQPIHLKPMTLGMLFEMYAGIGYDNEDDNLCFSEEITINELTENIHPSFKTSNGNQWARSDTSYLGKKYVVERPKRGGRTFAVRLDGPNYSLKKNRSIKKEIRSVIENKRCVILDVGSNIEVDHKNGKYNNPDRILAEDQRIENFQALSKAANNAKKMHCKVCRESGNRYDARNLGYKEGWIRGDENTPTCPGCYWYDPEYFNQQMTESFEKRM